MRVALQKSAWDSLLAYVEVPEGLTHESAHKIRTAITLAASRGDYRDRYLYCQEPSHRVPLNKFRDDGILLPFGSRRHDFQVPNP